MGNFLIWYLTWAETPPSELTKLPVRDQDAAGG
jgi:hypothetical protein